ncbi:MAG: AAA family ATPase [Spirochaetes bacterium]|nr:MAG: AAA family ATPase [Spirochaetota bacterium]
MNYEEIVRLGEEVRARGAFVGRIKAAMGSVIVGQDYLIERIIIAFMCGGHILLEGMPGLAKTLVVRAFARSVRASFGRIQFTPDLLPADLVGTRIYNPRDLDFFTRRGPVFTNILLADEINRAPAKVQSALLQAMEERSVTIGDETHALPTPFMVLATQNPIEQEGTYPLPEAQIDRFFMKCVVGYPAKEEERDILLRIETIDAERVEPVAEPAEIFEGARLAGSIHMDDKIVDYIVSLVRETRAPRDKTCARHIEFGASPRASIALMRAARALAFVRGRGYVVPDDIRETGADVLRHRIILTYDAEAEGKNADDVIRAIFDSVEVP